MSDKRFMIDDCGTLIDMHTRDTFDYVSDVCDLLNEQHETIQRLKQNITELLSVDIEEELLKENEQLKQFPVKLENRIQKLQEDLQKLTEMDKSDLNPQAIEDVATVISISLNALMEFQKELME